MEEIQIRGYLDDDEFYRKVDLREHLADTRKQLIELQELLDCRAGKLLLKGKFFVVVAEDEPYFQKVYEMIREHELTMERWTEGDEDQFINAIERAIQFR